MRGVVEEMKKYKNKYRIKSHRMPKWDYSGNGIYFLTIVTQNRVCNLGNIANNNGYLSIELSNFGKIVEIELLKSFEIRDKLFLDEYIIMPNHLHAIIVLDKSEIENNNDDVIGSHGSHVEMHGRASLQSPEQWELRQPIKQNHPIRKSKSISSFFAGFKSSINSKIKTNITALNNML